MSNDRYLSDAQVITHTLQSAKSFPCLISSLRTKLQQNFKTWPFFLLLSLPPLTTVNQKFYFI
ncbi:hypothetical protein G4228_014126 [Cervus hanglu yarkandensis]|nr:hypothetical protein G4228_014126 [Cervus hanglu yarkandensis]